MANCTILQKCYMLIETKDKWMGSQWALEANRCGATHSEAQGDNVSRHSCLPFLWKVGSLRTQQSPARASIPGEAGGKLSIRRLFEQEGFDDWSLCCLVPVSMLSCSVGGRRCMLGFNPQLAIY